MWMGYQPQHGVKGNQGCPPRGQRAYSLSEALANEGTNSTSNNLVLIPAPPQHAVWSWQRNLTSLSFDVYLGKKGIITAGSDGKESSCNVGGISLIFLGWVDPLEEGMAIHSSILAWRIPWKEEPGGLQSMGLQRVGHDQMTKHSTANNTLLAVLLWCLQEIMNKLVLMVKLEMHLGTKLDVRLGGVLNT